MATDTLDVYLNGIPAGQLKRLGRNETEFTYDVDYVASPQAVPLSHLMPLSQASVGPQVVDPWLANLLPENDRLLAQWEQQFLITDRTPFGFLSQVGYDLAGAIQILPHNRPLPTDGETEELTETQIATEIARLRAGQSAGDFADLRHELHDNLLHLSAVAGQQSKFALTKAPDGRWLLPIGRSPSTHIFKFGFDSIRNTDVVEHITQRAARILGLPAAHTEVMQFEDQLAVVIERFDRRVTADGHIARIHQEDLAQALGVPPALKYESDGGPGIPEIAAVLKSAATPHQNRRYSLHTLMRALIFNVITAGTDAHAKNYALLYSGPQAILAPLYDLNSALLLYPAMQVHNKAKMAMRYGNEYQLKAIGNRDLARTADEIGIEREDMAQEILTQTAGVADAFSQAQSELPPELASRMPNPQFVTAIASRAQSVARSLPLPTVAELPPQPRMPRRFRGQ